MRTLFSLACSALLLGVAYAQDVVVRAGTIYPSGGGEALTNGAAIWIQGGKIKAIGKEVPAPQGTPELDYGMGAVIAPGLVSTRSGYGMGVDAARAAAPFVQAIDNFDPFGTYHSALRAGVTTVYLEPGKADRLIAGQGAVVKLAGEDAEARVLVRSAGILGSIASNARFSPGFWEPRLPATADIGLGFENRQFPRTVMGAVVALRELIAFARGDGNFASEYGSKAGEVLGKLIQANTPWRLRAETDEEVAALIELFANAKMPLVIEGLERAPESASLLARANYSVIYQVTEPSLRDFGKNPDAERPAKEVAANLKKAGVNFAIQGWDPTSLRFAAGLAMRGGLDSQTALDGITYRAAEVLGVSSRVGSLQVGRDGDLAIFNGNPLDASASVLATVIDGKVVYDAREIATKLQATEAKKATKSLGIVGPMTAPIPVTTVLSVDELHLGDGEVLRPGELLVRAGKIVEVGTRVARPAGAVVVKGFAAMPGVVDTLGFLGMEGADPRLSKSFDMRRMLEPGDWLDREVAMAGTTTVNLTSRSQPLETTTLVYKPADADVERMVVRDRGAFLMSWPNGSTAAFLAKLAKYTEEWDAYEKALAEWEKNPPAPEAEKKADESKTEDKKDEEAKPESTEEGDADKKDDEGKKKKKKSKDKPEAKAVTGTYEAQVTLGGKENQKVRLRLLEGEEGTLEGTLRMADFKDLVLIEGKRDGYKLRLDAQTVEGGIALALELNFEDNDEEMPYLEGRRLFRGVEDSFKLPRTSSDYPVAKRPDGKEPKDDKATEEEPKEPKGKPKAPGFELEVEMLRRAAKGKASAFVRVDREDHIRACVDAFAEQGIHPVLVSALEAHEVTEHLAGRVKGVILTGPAVAVSNRGLISVNRFERLQSAGIPVAIASFAEEGSANLIDVATLAAMENWSTQGALRALTFDAASILSLQDQIGSLHRGASGDVLLLDGPPLAPSTRILKVWVNGAEVQR